MLAAALAAGLLAVAGGAPAGAAAPPLRVVVVSIASPHALRGNYAGRLAAFSSAPAAGRGELVAFVPAGDPSGCSQYSVPNTPGGVRPAAIAVVRPGNCSCTERALRAKEAGAGGVLLVSAGEAVDARDLQNSTAEGPPVELVVIGVPKSLGDKIAAWGEAHSAEPVRLSLALYKPAAMFDLSEVALIGLATSLVVAGAFFATADLRLGSPIAPKPEQVVQMDQWFPLAFCALGSCMLVVLYFLMKYLIYGIIFLFCVGGASCITELGHSCLRYRFPALQKRAATLPGLGPIERAQVIAAGVAAVVVLSWLVLRNTVYGWLFQDIIGAGFLCFMQRTLRLPSIKVAAALLSVMFCFDIFWVFISPLLFQQSVMVVVATGGGTGESVPMLLRVPAIGDALGRDRMLGFGDVALPGMLVSFLRRHDILSCRSLRGGYFAPAVAGYAVACCVTIAALCIMQMGQPALLYLVPGTLGTTLVLGWKRGELQSLWHGTPCGGGSGPGAGRTLCCYCPGGHLLQPWAAEAGGCNGCRRQVHAGEPVMDCRQCNWYLCESCRPRGPAPAGAEARDLGVALLPMAGLA